MNGSHLDITAYRLDFIGNSKWIYKLSKPFQADCIALFTFDFFFVLLINECSTDKPDLVLFYSSYN